MTTSFPTPDAAPDPGTSTTDAAQTAAVRRSLATLRAALESVQESLDQLEAELPAGAPRTALDRDAR